VVTKTQDGDSPLLSPASRQLPLYSPKVRTVLVLFLIHLNPGVPQSYGGDFLFSTWYGF
jgi:hypothetical protein